MPVEALQLARALNWLHGIIHYILHVRGTETLHCDYEIGNCIIMQEKQQKKMLHQRFLKRSKKNSDCLPESILSVIFFNLLE